MASGHSLPPPTPLDIHDQNAAEKWKKFNLAWNSYALATELDRRDENKIAPVLQKFAEYCQPRKNVPFERYRFNRRTQEAGESYDQYKTALSKLAEGCDFDTITLTRCLEIA
ncbi:unnamed protein product [Pocillopora meandrina]|uniref:Retrotransposon gag domain-containing protein n=1 Tax=Pocillopora meandrina TaxID=46732 RepID=A0AAU9VQX5_9CNID|nr:unnamed protein product [Pocillopora meandrina]